MLDRLDDRKGGEEEKAVDEGALSAFGEKAMATCRDVESRPERVIARLDRQGVSSPGLTGSAMRRRLLDSRFRGNNTVKGIRGTT